MRTTAPRRPRHLVHDDMKHVLGHRQACGARERDDEHLEVRLEERVDLVSGVDRRQSFIGEVHHHALKMNEG